MNNTSRITTKKLECDLKHNLSAEEIARKHKLGSVEELFAEMKNQLPEAIYLAYRSRLEKKSTVKKSSRKKKTAQTTEVELVSTTVEEPVQEPVPESETVEEQKESKPTLEELRLAEAQYEKAQLDLEFHEKEARQKLLEVRKSICLKRDEACKLRSEIVKMEEEVKSSEEHDFAILDEHAEAVTNLREIRADRAANKALIEERSIIYIFVDTTNGIYAEMDNSSVELEFGDWHPFYEKIISLDPETLGDIKVSEMILVAKLLTLAEGKYQFAFDNSHMEDIYDMVASLETT